MCMYKTYILLIFSNLVHIKTCRKLSMYDSHIERPFFFFFILFFFFWLYITFFLVLLLIFRNLLNLFLTNFCENTTFHSQYYYYIIFIRDFFSPIFVISHKNQPFFDKSWSFLFAEKRMKIKV
jgi:hypothetical protein